MLKSSQIDPCPNQIRQLHACGIKGVFKVLERINGLALWIPFTDYLPSAIDFRSLGNGDEW